MKQQITKLLKRQTKLNYDELLIISELEESELEKILQKLISEEVIKKVGDEYVYILPLIAEAQEKTKKKNKIKKYNSIKRDLRAFSTEIPKKEKVFRNEEEIEQFNTIPDYAKKFVLKYLTAMKAAGGLGGNALKLFLKNFAEDNPDYKVSYSSFMRAKRDYAKYGIAGIVPDYGRRVPLATTDEEYAIFKKLYLTPESRSLASCLKIMKEQGIFGDRIIIPSENTFKRRLLKDFSLQEIRQIRTKYLFIPEEFLEDQKSVAQNKNAKTNKNIEFMNCKNLIQASELFLKSDDFYSNKGAAQKNIQSVLNKHLLPFFKDMEFIDITDDIIDKFKIKKTSEGYRPASISIFLNILQKLISRYSKVEVKNYYTEAKTVDTELILTEEEMIKLLNKTQKSKLYIPLLLVFCLGLTLAELKALTWEDINLKTNKLSVNKIIANNELQKYRTRYQIREIYIPKSLRNILKKLTPQDFENLKNINDEALKRLSNKEITFLDLHNSYVNNLIQNKIHLNLIAKQIGLASTNELVEKYGQFINEKSLKKFDFAAKLFPQKV